MIVEKELRKIFQQLLQEDVVHIAVNGFDIAISVFDQASKLALSTPVYFGGNFIPKSVRSCISQKSPHFQQGHIKAFLKIDEENFQVSLNYLGKLNNEQSGAFSQLLEDFSILADEWRVFLDEHDKNDLVYVRVR